MYNFRKSVMAEPKLQVSGNENNEGLDKSR